MALFINKESEASWAQDLFEYYSYKFNDAWYNVGVSG